MSSGLKEFRWYRALIVARYASLVLFFLYGIVGAGLLDTPWGVDTDTKLFNLSLIWIVLPAIWFGLERGIVYIVIGSSPKR